MKQIKQNGMPQGLLCEIAKILGGLKIPYIVTGGMAVAVWARPRFTADIDIVVELMPAKIDLLAQKLYSIDKDAYLDKESIKKALFSKREFNFIHSQTGLKVDFWLLKDEPWDKERIKNPVIKVIDGQEVNFVSAEDLILSKLKWYKMGESAKQLEDVKSVLEMNKVDLTYIKNWAKEHSTLTILEKILQMK